MSSGIPPWRATASATATAPHFPAHATPAYIPVQARRSFAHTSTTAMAPQPQPTTTQAPRKRVEWPAPLRSYVQRSFAPENQLPGVNRQEMEVKLKTVITEAAEKNQLEKINWNALPLPQVMIQNERNQILTNPDISGWSASLLTAAQKPDTVTEDVSRKRKSAEYGDKDSCPPWRQTNNHHAFGDRTTYPSADKRQRVDHKNPSKSKANLELRRKRFEEPRARYGSSPSSSRGESPAPSANQGPVVGRCQELEKNYFRLTSAPNPDTVRPLHVLHKTLDLLKKKWKKDNNYGYICDQFKSLRQDLTVQHIRNEFTVSVYEIHARIALEKGDLDKRDPAVKHALDVRSALALGNYHRFFQLYLDTPNMGAYLMDMFVDRERLSALTAICKAYKPDVKIRFVTEELGFESDEQSARFILDHASEDLLQEKDGSVRLLTSGRAAQLFEAAKSEAHRVVDIKGQI
ncbi:protein scd2/ral3 [Aspergillus udagawae]|nr:protein scd2/ral3 [Aspergillus udagawae]